MHGDCVVILDPIFHRCIPTEASNTQWIPLTLLLGFELGTEQFAWLYALVNSRF